MSDHISSSHGFVKAGTAITCYINNICSRGEMIQHASSTQNSIEGDATTCVGLWVEEHFGVNDILGVGLLEVGVCQVGEVGCCYQAGHGGVVDFEKRW